MEKIYIVLAVHVKVSNTFRAKLSTTDETIARVVKFGRHYLIKSLSKGALIVNRVGQMCNGFGKVF